MKMFGVTLVCGLLLAACTQTGSSSGGTQVYGEIKSGVETSRTRTGN